MSEQNMTEIIFDAMLKEAVIANFRTKMEEVPSEEEILEETSFSDEHNRKMEEIFKQERRQTVARRFYSIKSYAKVAIFIISITATLTFAILLTSTEVRAALKNVIINIFERFTNIEYEEPRNQEKEAHRFVLQKIPDGFELTHTEIYGQNSLSFYENHKGEYIIFDVRLPNSTNFDNEDHKFYEVIYDTIIYYVNEALDDDKFSTIFWTIDGFMFVLQGNVAIETFLEIARLIIYVDIEVNY